MPEKKEKFSILFLNLLILRMRNNLFFKRQNNGYTERLSAKANISRRSR